MIGSEIPQDCKLKNYFLQIMVRKFQVMNSLLALVEGELIILSSFFEPINLPILVALLLWIEFSQSLRRIITMSRLG